jgi:hypothetical protein
MTGGHLHVGGICIVAYLRRQSRSSRTGDGQTINNVQLGTFGRNRTNVWEYAGQNVVTSERMQALAMHPTVKPVRLVADAILDCSKRVELILDGFAGSGTTIIAAEQSGRIACALELDPHYVDVAILRWERLTGEPARHEEAGLTFADMAREREGPALPPMVELSQPSAEGSWMTRSKISHDAYEVGYGRPPKHTRFKSGHSGNPKGRPKGTNNLKTDLMDELAERISIGEGGKPKKLSKQRALLKSLAAKAITGDARAMNILLNLMVRVLEISAEERESDLIRQDDLAILDNFIARQKRGTRVNKRPRKRAGVKL